MYHLILCVPRGILSIIITMERRCGQYSVTNCRNVGAMFPPSIFENRCVDLRRSMYQLSKIDDVGSICRPSRIDDRWDKEPSRSPSSCYTPVSSPVPRMHISNSDVTFTPTYSNFGGFYFRAYLPSAKNAKFCTARKFPAVYGNRSVNTTAFFNINFLFSRKFS